MKRLRPFYVSSALQCFFLGQTCMLSTWVQPSHGQCLSSIGAIVIREESVTDISVPRNYTLCPNTMYPISSLDYSNALLDPQLPMIPLRSNLYIGCGSDGSRLNGCVIHGGDLHVDGTSLFGLSSDSSLDQVIIQGLTFANATRSMVWIRKPGKILFQDCEFRESTTAKVPILMDYFDPDNPDGRASINFSECDFLDNVFAGPPAYPALVVGQGSQNVMTFQMSSFQRNDMLSNLNNTVSWLIDTNGPLNVVGSCFKNNNVRVAPIATYQQQALFLDNMGNQSNGDSCPFVSTYTTLTRYDSNTPDCVDYDSTFCFLDGTPSPSESPTSGPTRVASTLPTTLPSVAPTTVPSLLPSEMPSSFPTKTKSEMPTTEPSIQPSTMSSTGPTVGPTRHPSMAPSSLPTLDWSLSPTKFASDIPSFLPSGPPSQIPTAEPSQPNTVRPTTQQQRDDSNAGIVNGNSASSSASMGLTVVVAQSPSSLWFLSSMAVSWILGCIIMIM